MLTEHTPAPPSTVTGGGGKSSLPGWIRRPRPRGRGGLSSLWQYKYHYLLLTPMLILFIAFTAWPISASWFYSFYEWDGIGPLTDFVGLDNYREAAAEPQFWSAFRHSLYFAAVAIGIEMPLALLFAVVLNNSWLRGRNVYRLLIFLPVVTTTAVVGVIFGILLSPVGGPVNEVLVRLPFVDGPVNFLGSESIALPTIMAIDVWKSIGVTMIYWLAALQTIPQDVYDAAKIDGASARQTLLRITAPLLVPLGVVILLLTFQRSLNPFDLIQTMTSGGPNFSTDVIATYIYRTAFDPAFAAPQYGYASAAGIVFGLAVLVLTIVQYLAVKRDKTKGVPR